MSKIISQKTSLLDSALGPVAVTTTEFSGFNVDDYVSLTVTSKAEYLRLVNKASSIDPLEVKDRPAVSIGGTALGGYDAV